MTASPIRQRDFLRTDADDGTQQLFDYSWDQPINQWLYVIPPWYRAPLKQTLEQDLDRVRQAAPSSGPRP